MPAPPAAPAPASVVELVPVGSGISALVPQGYTVTSTSNGQVQLDKNGNTSVVIRVSPPQASTGPIIPAIQQEVSNGGRSYDWTDQTEVAASGKASQVTFAPFVTSGYVGGSLQNFHGALLAIVRSDASVSLFFITRSSADETPPVEAMLASLEQ